jgi:tRNA threonylcarbamoyladenosine biosynthesis protein TsaE
LSQLLKINTNSARETELAAAKFSRILKPGDILALYGELGAGKTCFVRGIAEGLGITANVKSPSFNLINEYPGDIPLFHIDFYRLETAEEIVSTGWTDYLSYNGIIAIEWADRVDNDLPLPRYDILIGTTGEDKRTLEIIANVSPRN